MYAKPKKLNGININKMKLLLVYQPRMAAGPTDADESH